MRALPLVLGAAALVAVGGYTLLQPFSFETGSALRSSGSPIHLLSDLTPQALREGWRLRQFFGVDPTEYDMVEIGSDQVLRCRTQNSASILARDMDVALDEVPFLSWEWKVTQPIESDRDEATEAGDDHPLRFFLRFSNAQGDMTATEIIWSNQKYTAGDYKIIGSFYHYVANGLEENAQVWHAQSLDLRKLYADIGGTGDGILETLGFFCDSDNTGAKSEGFFKNITLTSTL